VFGLQQQDAPDGSLLQLVNTEEAAVKEKLGNLAVSGVASARPLETAFKNGRFALTRKAE
jgi:hypothetical protein